MTYTRIRDMVALQAKSHECTAYGRKPFQIAGAVFNTRKSEYYVTVDVMNTPRPVYFRVRGKTPADSPVEQVPWFLPCPEMEKRVWINPDYKPFQRICFSADGSEIHDDPLKKQVRAKAEITMPDGSIKYGTVRIDYDSV